MLKKYLIRTSSSGYAVVVVDAKENVSVSTFRDDQGLSPLALISQARQADDPTFWQEVLADAVPLKAVPLK